ncbi:MAG: D-glycero-beta-D-manno-heptose 1-phosphate adenylyltransferase [Candidatus Kapaibacterium sp.]
MLASRLLISKISEEIRAAGRRIVFTNGCFDILHAGHVRYLAESRRYGDVLILGLNSDSSVKRLKGETRPVNSEADRAEVLLALDSVDFVSIFDEDTPFELISVIRPDIITKGGDYRAAEVVGADIVASYGGHVKIIPLVEGLSTTGTIGRITRGLQ